MTFERAAVAAASSTDPPDEPGKKSPKPVLAAPRTMSQHLTICAFVILPTSVLLGGAWFTFSWLNLAIFVAFYVVSCLGVTAGFHRYFTHGAFKAKPWLRVVMAVAGQIASQGSIIVWVADHRRHHAFSDRDGDPHSPWLFGTGPLAVLRGAWHSHMGWLFKRDVTNADRFAPDLVKDKAMRRVEKFFPFTVAASVLIPALIGGLVTGTWWGAISAFIFAGIIRIGFLHHITWFTNSICHMIGERPFASRDRAANFWPLALLSMGESWHNSHHADPTCARHGVKRGQIDITARLIWIFEKFGWAWDVRWPKVDRFTGLAIKPEELRMGRSAA